MKLKRGLLNKIVIALSALGIVAVASNVYATTDTSGGLTLGLERYRNSGYSYMAIEKVMWKISSYNGDVVNKDRAIYCLKGGPGFGSTTSMGSVTPIKRNYNQYFDMKDPNFYNTTTGSADYTYRKVLPTGENYNSLVWVLDHSYVPEPSSNPTTEQIELAKEYRKQLLTNAGIPNSKITDDEIDIVQQLAVWHFTNNDIYKVTSAELALALSPSTTYKELSDIDFERAEDVNILLDYFLINGKSNSKLDPIKNPSMNPILLDSSKSVVDSEGTNYILGPYKINNDNGTLNYGIDGKLLKGDTQISYTILDSNKQTTTKTLEELVGQNFYISVPKTEDISGTRFKIKATIYTTDITFWSVANAPTSDQPVAEVVRNKKEYESETEEFDLALRKFITNINGKELINKDGKYLREPSIDISPLVNKTGTTAIYKHQKDPVGISVGDIVIFTLRIYNEGKIDGYASSVTDYLPPQLEFVIDDEENFNAKYGWVIDSSLRKASTSILSKTQIDPEDNLIKAFDGATLDYKELKIKTRVVTTKDFDKVITNIAEITDFTDANGNIIKDRDSIESNINLPTDEKLPEYKGNDSNKSILSDSEYFYKGQEDDDDFDKLILEEFDLALRKFITGVNEEPVTNRIPVFTNVKDENGNYIYEHTKEPIEVDTTDIVEYTIRIYNEGDIDGYAKQIRDNIPSGLEFLPLDEMNITYRWKMIDENGNETQDVTKAKSITTDYLSKEQEKTDKENLIGAFDTSTMTSPNYKDVKVRFKVIAPSTHEGIITNIAEISDDSDAEGNPVEDKDSVPDNGNEKEDDIDKEHIKLSYFDLALRKFITAVNETPITNRVPVFKIDENGKYVYEHTKEPVEVENGNIVTYTLRIYNEGTKDGYAKEIKDDLPEGLLFLPENNINKEYRWIMIDKEGKETQDIKQAVSIKTDYLSKEQEKSEGDNLLTKFDSKTMEEPKYKEVKIAFKVTEPNTSDRILINKAQISDDSDKNGKPVIDVDSTPDKWIEGEDDQDIEKVKVKYFDLALRKWVTQAIIIDDGKQTVIETGHKPEDNPEEVVKVEIPEKKLNKIVVKFKYKIRITNEGQIAGYAKEISDYIPEGLKFVAAENKQWKEVDGKVVTDQLKDTLLQPGQTADVEILLTWINGKDNFGLKVNVAEISKDYNESNTPDIDSTPNNKKPGEDDIDDAPVIPTIKTGKGIDTQYIILAGGILLILATGIILIKKYVMEF